MSSEANESKLISDEFAKHLAQLGDSLKANTLKGTQIEGPLLFFAKQNQLYHCCLATHLVFDSERLHLERDNRHTVFSLDETLTNVQRLTNNKLRRLCQGNLSKVHVLTKENKLTRLNKYLSVEKKVLRKRPGRYLQGLSGPSSLPEMRKKISNILGIHSGPRKHQLDTNSSLAILRKKEKIFLADQAADFANEVFIEEELAKFPSRQ